MDEFVPMTALLRMRQDLLKKLDDFASAYLSDLQRRKVRFLDFYYFREFCGSPVFDLVNWEQINPDEIESYGSIKELFLKAAHAANTTISNDGSGDSGRRDFQAVATATLAIAYRPRMTSILCNWGFVCEGDSWQSRKWQTE